VAFEVDGLSIAARFEADGSGALSSVRRFIFDGDDTTRPNGLGLTVHRHCYRRDVGLERNPDSPDEAETDDGESEDSPSW